MNEEDGELWRALLRRWFVEYNPLYLASATLVFGGIWLVSRELAQHRVQLGALYVGGITELYACMLIAGAALLVRIRQTRAAAMLGLLAALFACDVGLQVETYAWSGVAGAWAAGVWLLLFAGKLQGLAWALRLRLSRSAKLAPMLGATGLAILPRLLREVSPATGTALVAVWLFGTFAAGLWTTRAVRSEAGLDVRALRAIRGTWLLWGAALLAHVAFWWTEPDLRLSPLVIAPALALLGVRFLRRERHVWTLVGAVLVAVGVVIPRALSLIAFLAVAALALRALRAPRVRPEVVAPPTYREAGRVLSTARSFFVREERAVLLRYAVGALTCAYVGLWTNGWTGEGAPEHLLALDAPFALAWAGLAWRGPSRLALVPLLSVAAHLGVVLGWLRLPRSAIEAGAGALGLGFVLLGVGIAVTWRLSRSAPHPRAAPAPRAR